MSSPFRRAASPDRAGPRARDFGEGLIEDLVQPSRVDDLQRWDSSEGVDVAPGLAGRDETPEGLLAFRQRERAVAREDGEQAAGGHGDRGIGVGEVCEEAR